MTRLCRHCRSLVLEVPSLRAKLVSRKFWIAVLSAGVAALSGHADAAVQIVLAYLGAQGLQDVAAAFGSK